MQKARTGNGKNRVQKTKTINFQVKMDSDLKKRAEAAVKQQGFDSLANAMRYWAVNVSQGNLTKLPYPRIEPVNIPHLSKLADKYEKQMARGDYTGLRSFDSVEDLINDLDNDEHEIEVNTQHRIQKKLQGQS